MCSNSCVYKNNVVHLYCNLKRTAMEKEIIVSERVSRMSNKSIAKALAQAKSGKSKLGFNWRGILIKRTAKLTILL